jgi:hypothetical protein
VREPYSPKWLERLYEKSEKMANWCSTGRKNSSKESSRDVSRYEDPLSRALTPFQTVSEGAFCEVHIQ